MDSNIFFASAFKFQITPFRFVFPVFSQYNFECLGLGLQIYNIKLIVVTKNQKEGCLLL